MPHLFCYGSLIYPAVWSRVVRGTYASVRAQLRGFQRRGVQGATYPCLIPGHQDQTVNGLLYMDIQFDDVARLDAFEGDLYNRQTIHCMDVGQRPHDAEVYVLKREYRSVATPTDWDEAWFEAEGLMQFLAEEA